MPGPARPAARGRRDHLRLPHPPLHHGSPPEEGAAGAGRGALTPRRRRGSTRTCRARTLASATRAARPSGRNSTAGSTRSRGTASPSTRSSARRSAPAPPCGPSSRRRCRPRGRKRDGSGPAASGPRCRSPRRTSRYCAIAGEASSRPAPRRRRVRRGGRPAAGCSSRRSPQRGGRRAGPPVSGHASGAGAPGGALRSVGNSGKGTAGDESGQELGGAGLPVNPLRRPALGGDPAPLVLRAEVFHVEAQHLVGPCGGLVEHLSLRLLPQSDVGRYKATICFPARHWCGPAVPAAARCQSWDRLRSSPGAATSRLPCAR